ncbi:MAG: ABC transporter permease [Anaeromyxobacter sp.]
MRLPLLARGAPRKAARLTGLRAWLDAVRRDRKASAGAVIMAVFLLLGLLGPLLAPSPAALVGVPHSPPSLAHWLGTTGQGQDVLAQAVAGTRASLALGFLVGGLVVLVGAVIGVTAGYVGGRVDTALSLLVNVFLVIPGLPLAIVIAAYLPAGPATVALVLTVTGWAWNARVLRAQTLALKKRDFVAAAVVAGEPGIRIVLRELLPNMTSLLVAQVIGSTVYAIGAQVGLEFLGLGDVSSVTWGTNLYWAANDAALLTGAWWTYVPTGLCIALVGFALTMLNAGFDEITNPRLQLERAWRDALGRAGLATPRSTPVVSRG